MTLAAVQTLPIKLNLGCGSDIRRGYVNVDIYGSPDVRLDLNSDWPWADNSVLEVQMIHVLEHLPDTVSVMKKLYRVCADGAKVHIVVPHPRNDDYLSDPTHVSPITLRTIMLFSRRICEKRQKAKNADTPLALIHGVDFEMTEGMLNLESKYLEKLSKGEISKETMEEYALLYSNVIKESEMTLRVCK